MHSHNKTNTRSHLRLTRTHNKHTHDDHTHKLLTTCRCHSTRLHTRYCTRPRKTVHAQCLGKDKATPATHPFTSAHTHKCLRGVVSRLRISQNFVCLFVDPSLHPSTERSLEQLTQRIGNVVPLACRRKSNAPQVERLHKAATSDHVVHLRKPSSLLQI
jgi:hypothetical protein